MAMTDYSDSQLSPREFAIMEAEQAEAEKARAHAISMKSLEINLAREEADASIKLKTLESKWSSWLKLPKLFILLPVLIIMAIGYAFRREAPRNFWRLLE